MPRVKSVRQEIEKTLERLEQRIRDAAQLVGDAAGRDGSLMARIGDRDGMLPMTVVSPPLIDAKDTLDDLRGLLQHCADLLEESPFEPEVEFQAAVAEMRSAIRSVAEQISSIDFVLGAGGGIQPWIEMVTKPQKQIVVKAAPLRVDELLAEHLYHPVATVIQTSATLRVGETWSFLADRLGWDQVERGRLRQENFSSPFDWKRQVLLGLPTDVPEPDKSGYEQRIAEMIVDTARLASGRTFVLFTSHRFLRRIAHRVRDSFQALGMPLLVQGRNLGVSCCGGLSHPGEQYYWETSHTGRGWMFQEEHSLVSSSRDCHSGFPIILSNRAVQRNWSLVERVRLLILPCRGRFSDYGRIRTIDPYRR